MERERGEGWGAGLGLGGGGLVKGHGVPEGRVGFLTCIPQMCSHHLSWAGTLDQCEHPPSLSLEGGRVSSVRKA